MRAVSRWSWHSAPAGELAFQIVDLFRLLGIFLAEPVILLAKPLHFRRRIRGRRGRRLQQPSRKGPSLCPSPLHARQGTESRGKVQEA